MKKQLLAMLGLASLMASGASDRNAKETTRELGSMVTPFVAYGGNGMYFPSKHPIQTYAAQNRAAKKRRRAK